MIEGQRRELSKHVLLCMLAEGKYSISQFSTGWGLCHKHFGGLWGDVNIEMVKEMEKEKLFKLYGGAYKLTYEGERLAACEYYKLKPIEEKV